MNQRILPICLILTSTLTILNVHTCILKIAGSKKVYIKDSSATQDKIYDGKYLVEQFR